MNWTFLKRTQAVLLLMVVAACGAESNPPPSANQVPVDEPSSSGTPVDRNEVGTASDCDLAQLDPPRVYGHKVKTLLTGLPLTSEELTALEARPEALSGHIDTWMGTEAFRGLLLRFFKTAFQQNELDVDGITTMLRRNNLNLGRFEDPRVGLRELLELNVRESFARSALRIAENGRPFSEVLTTDEFEMTTALLALQTLLEHRYVSDADRLVVKSRSLGIVLHRSLASAPPPEETLDPRSPNFLHFYIPGFENLCLPDDQETYAVQPDDFIGSDETWLVFSAMMGRPGRVYNQAANRELGGRGCQAGEELAPPLLNRGDFEDWRTVRFLPTRLLDETPTRFWDGRSLRQATSIRVRSERVGFFTTLGFFATWPTNIDNASRVTLNQTLITALGASFDGNTVSDFSPPNLDQQHSAPGSACFGCHQTLDPMRDFFRASYTFAYGLQDDPSRMAQMEPIFVFRGVRNTGQGVRDLSQILAEHPDFPSAWVQKMCFYATTKPCPESSEAFQTIVRNYEENGLNFKAMVKALFSSPLVTNAACVDGGTGALRSISRREQLCVQLSRRLGMENICGDDIPVSTRNLTQREIAGAIVSVPKDTFARGDPDPIIISDTSLFTRATREVTCTVIAERAFGEVFADEGRSEVLEALVSRLMGLPRGDPRHDEILAILGDHVDEGIESGATERIALQSAMVLACMSPGVAGLGF